MAIKKYGATSPKNSTDPAGSEPDMTQPDSLSASDTQFAPRKANEAQVSPSGTSGRQPLLKSIYSMLRSGRSMAEPVASLSAAKELHSAGKSDQPSGRQAFTNNAEIESIAPTRPLDHEKAGWVSPAYKHSRSVKLNPQLLAENRCVGYQHEAGELEYYRMLRTKILQHTSGKGNTVMVTSAGHGEGKTLTAINLAFTFAREYKQTALLVDCNLRHQQIHERLGYSSDKGIVDYLMDDISFSDLIVWPGVEKLTVISGGKTVKDRSELLGSVGMKNVVEEIKNRYDDRYVIFDVPPLLTCADALTFAPLVDYVLVVVHAGKTSHHEVNKALKLLPKEKILGLVMNRQQA
jgi:non-specific protein-tyrosine kinase